MKKLLLVAIAMMVSTTMFAQQGAMFLGGTAGFHSLGSKDQGNADNDVTGSTYNLGPSFGYMLNDNMAVGINLLFEGGTATPTDASGDPTVKTSGYTIEPFFRYYFAGGDNFKFFGDALVGFGGGNTKQTLGTTTNESKYSTFGINIKPGMQYWFNDNWSMVSTIGLLGYNSRTNNVGETDGQGNSRETVETDFGLEANFNLNFGFYFHF